MHFLKLFCYIITISLSLSMSAAAEEKPRTGMAYTTMGYSGEKAKPLTTFQTKKIEPIQDINTTEDTESEAAKIWEHYKALAAGKVQAPTKNQPSDNTAPKQPTKTHHETPPKQEASAQKPATGFGAILKQYNEKKENRGGMQSRTITTPTKPARPTLPAKAEIK